MKDLKGLFNDFGIKLDDTMVSQFENYLNLLIDCNKKVNLTAITDPYEIYVKHFLDSSLPILSGLFKEKTKVADIGCGAGFPSIPLKILNPDLEFTLIDSLNKRIDFLALVIKKLCLENVSLIHDRAENAGGDSKLRESFEICVARAVAPLNVLLEYCVPFIKKGGCFIALKGRNAQEEIENASNAIKILSVEVENVLSYTLPLNNDLRKIIIFRKVKNTDLIYPRKAGKPTKSPL